VDLVVGAICAANLLEKTRTTMAGLNAANERISEQRAAERTSQAHRRFTEFVLAGGKAEDVARAVAAPGQRRGHPRRGRYLGGRHRRGDAVRPGAAAPATGA
jgi:hypothetical protein